MAKRKAKQQARQKAVQAEQHPSTEVVKTNDNDTITGFAWDGTMDQIHLNVDQKDWRKFQLFNDYIEIHNDDDVDLVDKGDYVLHDHKTNHYSSCSKAKYQQTYAK